MNTGTENTCRKHPGVPVYAPYGYELEVCRECYDRAMADPRSRFLRPEDAPQFPWSA